ncbi:hypothetical protein [Bradyrhizobium sp.]|jgi:hypothetical protein|uniref:hypothetical protein n=1 Tax=Bradyrhizobium sp. TaxID=376 RepID=UPI003BB17320
MEPKARIMSKRKQSASKKPIPRLTLNLARQLAELKALREQLRKAEARRLH